MAGQHEKSFQKLRHILVFIFLPGHRRCKLPIPPQQIATGQNQGGDSLCVHRQSLLDHIAFHTPPDEAHRIEFLAELALKGGQQFPHQRVLTGLCSL